MAGEKILFVDDEEQIRKLVSAYLEPYGYQVCLADDGIEGLRSVKEDPPHLVIADVNMPFINGLEFARKLRESSQTARIPIILLSAHTSPHEVLAGYGEGVDEYVPKPVEMSVLAAKVETVLRRAYATMPLRRRANGSTPPVERRLGRVLVFAHARGGVGTSTIAVNTSIALALAGTNRVALLDLDLEFGSSALMLDVQPRKTLTDFAGLSGGDLDDETFWHMLESHGSGVRLITPGAPDEARLLPPSAIRQVIRRLRQDTDYVLVDTAAHLSEPNAVAIEAADIVCLVTTQQLPALKATKDYMAVLERMGIAPEHIVLVLSRTVAGGPGDDQVRTFFGRAPDAVIPFSPMFGAAANSGRALMEAHAGTQGVAELRELAARLAELAPVELPGGGAPRLRKTA